MSNGLTFIIIVGLAMLIIVGGVTLILLEKVEPQARIENNNDYLRQIAVTDIASTINHYFDQNDVSGVNEHWQQLGTAQEGCNLKTIHCQLDINQCLNLSYILDKNIAWPVDPEMINADRSGYAVRAIAPQMIEIKACYTEAATPIVQRVRIE